jgi:hypothetical protein
MALVEAAPDSRAGGGTAAPLFAVGGSSPGRELPPTDDRRSGFVGGRWCMNLAHSQNQYSF